MLRIHAATRDPAQMRGSQAKEKCQLTRPFMATAVFTPAECSIAKLTLVFLLWCQ